MAAHRQVIGTNHIASLIHNLKGRVLGFIPGFDDYLLAVSGLVVRLLTISYAFNHIFKLSCTIEFSYNNTVKRVPFANAFPFSYLLTVFDIQSGAVWDRMRRKWYFGIFIDDSQFCQPAHNNVHRQRIIITLTFNRAEFVNLHKAVVAGFNRIFGRNISCNTPHMESTKRQLSTRFTNRLCRYHTHSFTLLHNMTGGKVASITFGTNSDF